MTHYILREYQEDAVREAVNFFKGNSKSNALEVLPTGSGKSLVIANVARQLNAPVLIFQPTKEILEQNYEKMCSYGFNPAIYSASKNRKEINLITFATIGSVKNKAELFKHFPYVIVDEAHFVNSKRGMYSSFLNQLTGTKVLGLTATPYRLVTDGFGGSILKFITRTRPRIFKDLIYYVQNGELFSKKYLAPLRYYSPDGFDRSKIRLNSTGADYDDQSLRQYYFSNDFPSKLLNVVQRASAAKKNALVFTRFLDESNYLVNNMNGQSVIVTGDTPKFERERIISGFKSGRIKTVCNVGVLTTGFDYPELETIIVARPTLSLALWYQMIGRAIRPHPQKEYAQIVDMCGNLPLFGKIEDLKIVDGKNGKWFISSRGKKLTNVYYGDR